MLDGVTYNHSAIDDIRSLTSSESRMRRRIILNSQRFNINQPVPVPVLSDESITSTPATIKRKQQEQPDPVVSADLIKSSEEKSNVVKKRQRKCSHKYYPDKPMSKEQETIWRREARRLRNRESARASRAKVQNRLKELEEEVELWKKKYHELQSKVENRDIITSTNADNHLIENDNDIIPLSPCYTPDATLSPSLLSNEEDPYTALDKDLWHLDLIQSENSLNFLDDDDFSDLTDIMH